MKNRLSENIDFEEALSQYLSCLTFEDAEFFFSDYNKADYIENILSISDNEIIKKAVKILEEEEVLEAPNFELKPSIYFIIYYLIQINTKFFKSNT